MSSYLPQQYGQTQLRPLFWQELIAIAVNIMILVAIGSWIFTQITKVRRGEEIERPF
jgi:hypothetical protein